MKIPFSKGFIKVYLGKLLNIRPKKRTKGNSTESELSFPVLPVFVSHIRARL